MMPLVSPWIIGKSQPTQGISISRLSYNRIIAKRINKLRFDNVSNRCDGKPDCLKDRGDEQVAKY